MKRKITSVIFDYGGVISRPHDLMDLFGIISSDHADLSLPNFRKSYTLHRMEYDRGMLNGLKYWEMITRDLSITMDEMTIRAVIRKDVESWFKINDRMLQFISEIKNKVKYISLLSNINYDCVEYMKLNCDWLKMFNNLIFSCELKTLKPDVRIYQVCLEKIREDAQWCLFVDDSEENVNASVRLGINGHHFTNLEQLEDEIDAKYLLSR